MILVTGGTGLVGSHLLYELTKNGEKVRAIYRSKEKIKKVKHVFSYYTTEFEQQFSKIEWVKADIIDVPSLMDAFEDVSIVYHCAAFISFDPRDYYMLRRINIEGTANIVNLCLANNVSKLCHMSSVATTGKSENKEPISEETHWNTEDSHNVYAITKYGAEMEIWRGTQEGLNAIIVNPGIIIGPGFWRSGSGSLIKFVYKGVSRYTNGSAGYVAIEDVVTIMIQLMEETIINERYILVAENLVFKDFFTNVADYLNVKPPFKLTSKLVLSFAWRLDWIRSLVFRKRRRLTKHIANTLLTKSNYSSEKIKNTLNFNFKPIEASIESTCQLFLKDLN